MLLGIRFNLKKTTSLLACIMAVVLGCKTARLKSRAEEDVLAIQRAIHYYNIADYQNSIDEFEILHQRGIRDERIPLFYAQAILENSGLDLIDFATSFKVLTSQIQNGLDKDKPEVVDQAVDDFLSNLPHSVEGANIALDRIENMYLDYVNEEVDSKEVGYYQSQLFYFRFFELLTFLVNELVHLEKIHSESDGYQQLKMILSYFDRESSRGLISSLIQLSESADELSPKIGKVTLKFFSKFVYTIDTGNYKVKITLEDLDAQQFKKSIQDLLAKALDRAWDSDFSKLEEIGVDRTVMEGFIQSRSSHLNSKNAIQGVDSLKKVILKNQKEIDQGRRLSSDPTKKKRAKNARKKLNQAIEKDDWSGVASELLEYSKK